MVNTDDVDAVTRARRLGRMLTERAQSGYVAFSVNKSALRADTWTARCEFGQEAVDSPMVAGANYGLGDTADEAIDAMLDEAKVA